MELGSSLAYNLDASPISLPHTQHTITGFIPRPRGSLMACIYSYIFTTQAPSFHPYPCHPSHLSPLNPHPYTPATPSLSPIASHLFWLPPLTSPP
jgi:hypothetical protein